MYIIVIITSCYIYFCISYSSGALPYDLESSLPLFNWQLLAGIYYVQDVS